MTDYMIDKSYKRAFWSLGTSGHLYAITQDEPLLSGFDVNNVLHVAGQKPVNGLNGVTALYAIPSDNGPSFWVTYGTFIYDEKTAYFPIVPVLASDDSAKVDWIIEHLPHGSGINYDWSVDSGRKHITCKNAFDTMHQNGMYGPAVDFTVRYTWDADMQKPELVDVTLNHRGGVWLYDDYGIPYNDRGGLTDYLEQTLDLR